jgi:type VI secretion system secreted protein Hcp
MAGYAKIGKIEGESTEQNHQKWINIESISNPISRSIPEGARDQERARGTTTLSDMVLSRPLDKSSVKLAEACANGTFYDEVDIHLASQINNEEKVYLEYKLKNVIVTSYSMSGTASGNPQPSEVVTLNFTEIEWTYNILDPEKGNKTGNVPAKFSMGKKKA